MALDTPGERDLRRANRDDVLSDLALDLSFDVTDRVSFGSYSLWQKYNLYNGTYLYNENLRLLDTKDIYKDDNKYHAIYGVTSKDELTSGGTSAGAYLIRHTPLTLSNDLGSDGASSLSSMSGDKIFAPTTDLGDVDHEEYYTTASDTTNKETLDALDMGTCELKELTIKWDEYPRPRWCPIITKVEWDAYDECPTMTIDINSNSNDHTKVDCVYGWDRGCGGDDGGCALREERPWLDVDAARSLSDSLVFQQYDDPSAVRHGWWKEYSIYTDDMWTGGDSNRCYYRLEDAVMYYVGEEKDSKECSEDGVPGIGVVFP